VPEALNRLDDARPGRREEALALLDALQRRLPSPGPQRIGVTGAPGAGKSSLLDALVRRLRARGETLGIVAVDPSSQRTGGALLGDRVRVRASAGDPGVFFRSMAARDRLGGLSDATRGGVVVLSAVFDRVFVETVGVGQSETDVAALVDTLLYVAQPGAGDMLQFMKAGVLELPDVFVVNKSDLGPAARRTAGELEAGLGLGERAAEGAPGAGAADGTGPGAGAGSPAGAGASGRTCAWTPPVLLVSARDGAGLEALVDALDRHRAHLAASGELARRRRRGREAFVRDALLRRYGSHGVERVGGEEGLLARLRRDEASSEFALLLALGREVEEALRKPAP